LGQGSTQRLPPGATLADRYLIQDVIGIGGMGAVYRARDMHFPNVIKLVAVKEMLNLAADPYIRKNIAETFEREAHILVTLTHASIPKIFDYFNSNQRSYLVLEYIQGKDLERLLDDSEDFIPYEKVVGWMVELCDVLQYLHSHKPEPVIFRDMKPSNIMINQQGHVVLVDFGIAKIFKTGQKGTMIGTEGYSPPEQYRGEASTAADVYALGATLHHVLTRVDPRGQPPFSFSERPLHDYNPSIPSLLQDVVTQALQYNPGDRFTSAEDMKQALLQSITSNSPAEPPSSKRSPTGTEENRLIWKFSCEDEIRGSPVIDNGIIYVGSYDKCLYAIKAVDGTLVWKYQTEGGIVGRPVLQEDEVFIGSEDQKIYAISIRSGKLSWLFDAKGPIRNSPRISQGHLFFGADDGVLYAINMPTTRCIWKVETGGPIRSTPCITENSIIVGNEAGDVFCVDFRGQIRWRFKAKRAVTSSPIIDNGLVYLSSLDGMLYALDINTGWATWKLHMDKGSVSSPCIQDKAVIVGSVDGNIYCVDAANGKETWRFRTGHQVSGSPISDNERVFCGSADGSLYCLKVKNGSLLWKYITGGPITGTPLVNNNTLYVGSLDHILYALSVQDSEK
jgi:eukaryotic-like serine/threonine-protein kinase